MTYTQADANAMPETLPLWPKESEYRWGGEDDTSSQIAFAERQAEAALARLRVAVEALQEMEGYWDVQRAEKALAAIGEVPSPVGELPKE